MFCYTVPSLPSLSVDNVDEPLSTGASGPTGNMLALATVVSCWLQPPGPPARSKAGRVDHGLLSLTRNASIASLETRTSFNADGSRCGRRPVGLTALGVEVGVWRSPLANEALGLLLTLLLVLSPVLAVSQVISAYAIPTRSMDSTLKVGDVVLAEKLSSILRLPLVRGDLVFFEPPDRLAAIVADSGVRLGGRDRFVKRVAAVAGDVVQLDQSGRGVLVNGEPRMRPTLACSDSPLPPQPPQPSPSPPPPRSPATVAVRTGSRGDTRSVVAAQETALGRVLQAEAEPEVLQRLQALLTATLRTA